MLALTILNLVLLAQVHKEEIPATRETVYRVSEGNACSLSWTLARAGPNRTVAQLRKDCDLPFERMLSMCDQILDTVEKTEPQRFRALETLFVGGLSGMPEMRSRLALLAAGSGEWDSARGKPKSGGVDALVQRYAQHSGFLKGWEEMFRRHGIQIQVGGVEDVRIEKAGSLPFFDELRRHGIGANYLVPSTCLLWIRLIHTEKGDRQQ
ncbi:MAG: hypothetical protein WBY44_13225 [Bryobacteraceae bacterium]|jgi:hypothetical protein